METLVVLYFIDLTFGSAGQGRVSRNDLATWFRVSKPTVAKFMKTMVDDGLVRKHEVSAKIGNGFIVKYSMTVDGKEHLDNHFDAAYQLYRIHVAKIIEAITAKEQRQIEAEQKEMF